MLSFPRFWIFATLVCAWLVAPFAALLAGPAHIPAADLMALLKVCFLNAAPDNTAAIIELRLGRTFASLLCGGGLAVAGATLQGVLRNPLADPFTLGISQGAALGASLAIVCDFTALNLAQGALITLFAFCGAMVALACALLLCRAASDNRETIILAGIAVSTFMGALVMLIKALNEESVASIVFWLMGSMQGKTLPDLPLLACTTFIGLIIILSHWRELDAIRLGRMESTLLGLKFVRARLILLAGASLMTAGCVSLCGIIGFIGLVTPHILRKFLGSGHGGLLAASFFGGGLLLLTADCVGRSILSYGQELPAGVLTALMGGPFFAFILHRTATNA